VEWLLILSVAIVAGGLMAALLIYERHVLRQRVLFLLRWIDDSLAGHGHISSIRWVSDREIEVPVRLRSGGLRKACFHFSVPRPLTWDLIRMAFRKPQEASVEFSADLDSTPGFAVEMKTMRWFARSRAGLEPTDKWTCVAADPILITTKLNWEQEINRAFQALLSSNRGCGLDLQFQKQSPHFRARFEVACNSTEQPLGQPFLNVLLSVAGGASAPAA
jgi:hypothetical protein